MDLEKIDKNNTSIIKYSKTDNVLTDICSIIESARDYAFQSVNLALVERNWLIGYRIAEEELKGEDRANYGTEVIKKISKELTKEYGKGFDRSNLYYFLKFYKNFPGIVDTVSRQSRALLSWSHYRTLLQVLDKEAREWYEKEALGQTWSVRTLQRNISSQYAFWQTVIEVGGKYAEFPISAEFLQHSLDGNPEDLYITDGNIVETIKNDNNFQNIIKKIVDEKGKDKDSFEFNSKDYVNHEYDWAFNDKDLYFALHLVELKVSALKENDKWNLDIKIHDTYDYSKAKNLFQYYNDTNSIPKSILSSSLYNLAAFSNYFKVMKIYDIDIEFTINDYQ